MLLIALGLTPHLIYKPSCQRATPLLVYPNYTRKAGRGEGNRTLKFQDENLVTITNLSTPPLKWQPWPVTLRRLLLEREARLLLLHRAIEIQLNDIALYLMWQSPPHGSLFFFGQSLANLLTIIGNGGWSRTIISGGPDVLKLESEVGIGPTFAVLQTDAYSSIDNSPMLKWQGQSESNTRLRFWRPR